jgi:hypothetical protein
MEVCKAFLADGFPLQSVGDFELPYNGQLLKIEGKNLGKGKKTSSGRKNILLVSFLFKRGEGW